MRIDKFMSDSGLLSRKEAALAAKRGELLLDGEKIPSVSQHIDPEKQKITYKGTPVLYRPFTYIMLNKPEGYVSATDDKKLPCVTELLPEVERRKGLFPAGRLDRDTVGLLILTNDGALSHDLLSPKHHVEKKYRFRAQHALPPDAEVRFAEGLEIDGYVCKSAGLSPDPDRMGGIITLTEGKYHQIKRMLEALDNKITFLERITFGGIGLDETLPRGGFRYLTDDEIDILRQNQN